MLHFMDHIFDADGTLFDTEKVLLETTYRTYVTMGIPVDRKNVHKGIIRAHLHQMIGEITPDLDEKTVDAYVTAYQPIEHEMIKKHCTMFPGVKGYLEKLRKNGKNLYIATNRPHRSIMLILEKEGVRGMFKDVYAPDKNGIKNEFSKQAMVRAIMENHGLACGRTLMYGDMVGDMVAAKACGIKAVAVLYGMADDLERLKKVADFHVESPHGLQNPRPKITMSKDHSFGR